MTAFARILGRAVEATPGALAATFAAGDGELVDAAATGHDHEWALLTAHHGVILANLEALLGTKHFGGAEHFVICHRGLEVVVQVVDDGYYALLALTPPAPLARAIANLATAAAELRREMQ